MITFRDLVPEITDEDIIWISGLMKLKGLDEQRLAFLRSRETLDVSACPGSGKTTLLVAKLAILARNWKSRTRGICVLSHTNVAREEIEHRLGNTDVGRRLLSYPHCIDTIHGFVRRFLATPWLLSGQHRFTAIDDELNHRVRSKHMWEEPEDRRILGGFLGRRTFDTKLLRLANADFSNPRLRVARGNLPCGPDAQSYQIMSRAVGKAARQGYFCYDEIFLLGTAQLGERPSVAEGLRYRFPCVFIDEMQDTSAMQNDYMNTIFPRDNPGICVTRVGDPNQAIFESDIHTNGSDFPDRSREVDISSSFRFDESIAALANPFAFHAVAGGLSGRRSKGDEGPLRHTIFIFPDGDCSGVLDAYGRLVLQELPTDLHGRAKISAIGYTHRDFDTVDADPLHYPKTVGHYWEGYDRNAGSAAYRPPTLIERIRQAKRNLVKGDTAHHSVEEIAKGLLHLVNLINLATKIKIGARQHVQVQQLFTNLEDLVSYQQLVVELLFTSKIISTDSWSSYARRFWDLASVLAGAHEQPETAQGYLAWIPESVEVVQEGVVQHAVNTFRSTQGNGVVDIKLGSIHSSKGQTHTATLVLETFNYDHFIASLLPWATGQKIHGGARPGKRITQRLLAMYVAMTRPTHLLCLAISRRTLSEGEAFDANCARLREQGWDIEHL
ncbi:UvrD/REP helicase [Pseudomonas syringae pv. philadelphi]|uniref:UvrD/REP helicase n=1 Tax=Pseudomonas syringae pv. philadelphi TaxID=251706 RepID=A0A3M3YUV2_9PSED|nr:UvrD-helicase domain-containing protein [Pseudomonas syringae group genomosp. 3]RMO86312.1 UvrD/REP helicase [Pseudomonas syringae pv. philadelphi]